MTWQMNVDPLGNIGLSALVAAIPILFLFWALAIKRMKGHFAAMGGTGLAVLIAVLVFKMPLDLAALATLYGGAFGLFPVCWIVITALFIYNMSVETGQFEVIKNSLASISDDRRLQALLIAFSFGAFIEGGGRLRHPGCDYGGHAGWPGLQSALCGRYLSAGQYGTGGLGRHRHSHRRGRSSLRHS